MSDRRALLTAYPLSAALYCVKLNLETSLVEWTKFYKMNQEDWAGQELLDDVNEALTQYEALIKHSEAVWEYLKAADLVCEEYAELASIISSVPYSVREQRFKNAVNAMYETKPEALEMMEKKEGK